MLYIELPEKEKNSDHRLSFYLAMEEWVARRVADKECFFMWQVKPSVIIGHNQDINSEVNLDYCRDHDIQVFRRKSGGGCVYADMSNVMLAYITTSDHAQKTFAHYLEMVAGVLSKMGIKASWTEHNDIMIGDRKVSGNAFYHITTHFPNPETGQLEATGRSIVHGTLLYDTEMENMIRAITPPDEKLVKHGVQSVRQRICLLKDYTPMSLEEIKAFIHQNIADSERPLTDEEVVGIRQIESSYLSPQWIKSGIRTTET